MANDLISCCAILPAAARTAKATLRSFAGHGSRAFGARRCPAPSVGSTAEKAQPPRVKSALRADVHITRHSANRPSRCAALHLVGQPLRALRVRGTRRYVSRPCAAAKPISAPCGRIKLTALWRRHLRCPGPRAAVSQGELQASQSRRARFAVSQSDRP